MRLNRYLLLATLSAVIGLLLLVATPAIAADGMTIKEQMVKKQADLMAAGMHGQKNASPDYGTLNGTTVNVHSYEFQGNDPFNDQISDDGNAYRYFRTIASGSQFMSAPVNIPSGVIIDYVRISDCVNANNDFLLGLWDDGFAPLPETGTNICFVSAVATCGYDSAENLNYLYTSNYNHPLYLLLYWTGATDGSTRFNDVAIGYHRVVSPAPGSPTFNDVPPSDGGFQYIEALVASGITAGCGGGNYCPDSPLTRRQMAVFLSKAFGLHWPD